MPGRPAASAKASCTPAAACALDFATSFDPLLRFALLSGVAVFAITLLLGPACLPLFVAVAILHHLRLAHVPLDFEVL